MADAVFDPDKKGMEATRPYLAQGAGETVGDLRKRFAGMITQGGFSQGDGASGALADKINAQGAERLGDLSGSFDRNMPFAYSKRQAGFQGVSQANQEILAQEEMLRKQKEAAEKAKRGGFASAALGLAGAGVGAYFGGAPGAMLGGGAGSALGSQV